MNTTVLRLAILASLAACDRAGTGHPGGGGQGPPCATTTPLPDPQGGRSGLVRCNDGSVNRVDDPDASTMIPGPACTLVGEPDCEVDGDCVDGSHGRCLYFNIPELAATFCECDYACATDIDCSAGQACLHPNGADLTYDLGYGTCRPADCRTGADCASGECGLSAWQDGGCGTEVSFHCRDAGVDRCRSHADCDAEDVSFCAWDASSGRFACQPIGQCTIGRPLTVDDGARVAAPTDRRDWIAAIALPDVDPALRDRMAEAWRAIAAMEHASVASFARFTLELLALGAPPDLLADTQRAALDEVEHARLAWALASRFAGTPLGPGPLSLDGVVPATHPEAVLDRLIDEACVGETVGTALVREAARHVTDPALRAVLDRTADDETRHAALAWRALRWLVAAHPELAPSVPGRFAAAVARLLAGLRADEAPPAPAWGLLGAEVSVAVARDAVLGVVEPCLRAVVAA